MNEILLSWLFDPHTFWNIWNEHNMTTFGNLYDYVYSQSGGGYFVNEGDDLMFGIKVSKFVYKSLALLLTLKIQFQLQIQSIFFTTGHFF